MALRPSGPARRKPDAIAYTTGRAAPRHGGDEFRRRTRPGIMLTGGSPRCSRLPSMIAIIVAAHRSPTDQALTAVRPPRTAAPPSRPDTDATTPGWSPAVPPLAGQQQNRQRTITRRRQAPRRLPPAPYGLNEHHHRQRAGRRHQRAACDSAVAQARRYHRPPKARPAVRQNCSPRLLLRRISSNAGSQPARHCARPVRSQRTGAKRVPGRSARGSVPGLPTGHETWCPTGLASARRGTRWQQTSEQNRAALEQPERAVWRRTTSSTWLRS